MSDIPGISLADVNNEEAVENFLSMLNNSERIQFMQQLSKSRFFDPSFFVISVSALEQLKLYHTELCLSAELVRAKVASRSPEANAADVVKLSGQIEVLNYLITVASNNYSAENTTEETQENLE